MARIWSALGAEDVLPSVCQGLELSPTYGREAASCINVMDVAQMFKRARNLAIIPQLDRGGLPQNPF